MILSIGRIVLYCLTEKDAESINKRREDSELSNIAIQDSGYIVHTGSKVKSATYYPMIITKIDPVHKSINGQVILDGNDTLWVTNVLNEKLESNNKQYEGGWIEPREFVGGVNDEDS